MIILPGYWRLTDRTTGIEQCAFKDDLDSTCLGGPGTGQCMPGYDGPLCEQCAIGYFDEKYYYKAEDLRCTQCPEVGSVAIKVVVVLFSLLGVAVLLYVLVKAPPTCLRHISTQIKLSIATMKSIGLQSKIKITISFYQIITVMDSTYSVELPDAYSQWLQAFTWIGELDWISLTVATECITPPTIDQSMFQQQLRIRGLGPLVLTFAIAGASTIASVLLFLAQRRKLDVFVAELAAKLSNKRTHLTTDERVCEATNFAASSTSTSASPPHVHPPPMPPTHAEEASIEIEHEPTSSSLSAWGAKSTVFSSVRASESQVVNDRNTQTLKAAVKMGLLNALPLALWITFVLAPSLSANIFRSWLCISFGFESGTDKYFLKRDMYVECYTDGEHMRITSLAWIFVGMWPVGLVILYTLLLILCRNAILQHTPTKLSRATRFLHRDYKPSCFMWEPLELVRRTALTGWVILIDESLDFIRLLVGFIASLAFTVILLSYQPYLRREDGLLAILAQVVIVCVFLCAILLDLFNSFMEIEHITSLTGLASKYIGFTTTTDIVTTTIACSLAIIIAAATGIFFRIWTEGRVKYLRLRHNKQVPEVGLSPHMLWHLFLSHVWSDTQDAASVMKRQLQRLLPNVNVFLDVDDLADISLLEAYIERTSVIAILLSKNYFWSVNCLREARATVLFEKQVINVHEVDPLKGGAPLEEIKECCPADCCTHIFKHPVVRWYRLPEFQMETLKAVAIAMLSATPLYKRLPNLEVFAPGDLLSLTYYFKSPVVLFSHKDNEGAEAFAEELLKITHYAQTPHKSPSNASNDAKEAERRFVKVNTPGHTFTTTQQLPDWTSWQMGEYQKEDDPGTPVATHFLLYLNKNTFVDEKKGERLAEALQSAMLAGMPLVLVQEFDHERGGCEFAEILRNTPEPLFGRGIYKKIATPLNPGLHREVSLILVAKKMGAQPRTKWFFGQQENQPSDGLYRIQRRLTDISNPKETTRRVIKRSRFAATSLFKACVNDDINATCTDTDAKAGEHGLDGLS